MAYKVLRSVESDRDLSLIFDHLLTSYTVLGDSMPDAFERAATRIRGIVTDMESLGTAPHQGTMLPDVMPGLRHVTENRAIFYFTVDEIERQVRVLAVFFGGQDHQRHMLVRLLSRK